MTHDDARPMPPGAARAIGHDEWLLDESIRASFPASDPVSCSQPGSLVNVRCIARERHAVRRTHAHASSDERTPCEALARYASQRLSPL